MSGARLPVIQKVFTSNVLGREVVLTLTGKSRRGGLVFICLGEVLATVLTKHPLSSAKAAMVSYTAAGLAEFRLSLASLDVYSTFLRREVLPLVQALGADEGLQIVLLGQQFWGVLALYTASRFPRRFLGALGISASLWWKPEQTQNWEWFSTWLAEQPACPGKIFLMCSSQSALDRPRGVPTTLMANRHLRDVLTAKSCQVRLTEGVEENFSNAFFSEFERAVAWFERGL